MSRLQHSKGKKRPRGWHRRGHNGYGERCWRILTGLDGQKAGQQHGYAVPESDKEQAG